MQSAKTRLSQRKTSARTVFTTSERGQDLAIFKCADPLAAETGRGMNPSRYEPPHRRDVLAAKRLALRGGEGGIRTRGRLLTYARLASGYLRPLGHLSGPLSRARNYPQVSGRQA